MKKLVLFLFAFLLLANVSANEQIYQEFATSYSLNPTEWFGFDATNQLYGLDGRWDFDSSYAMRTYFSGLGTYSALANLTYNKMNNAVGADWQIASDVSEQNMNNVTIPTSCWDAYGDRLDLRVGSFADNAVFWSSYDCWNGTDWENLYNVSIGGDDQHAYFVEDAIYWNVTSYDGSLEVSNVDFCGLYVYDTNVLFNITQNIPIREKGFCFKVYAGNVTIEGNGFNINQTIGEIYTGIEGNLPEGQNNLTIRNLNLVDVRDPIRIFDTSSLLIDNVHASNGHTGLEIYSQGIAVSDINIINSVFEGYTDLNIYIYDAGLGVSDILIQNVSLIDADSEAIILEVVSDVIIRDFYVDNADTALYNSFVTNGLFENLEFSNQQSIALQLDAEVNLSFKNVSIHTDTPIYISYGDVQSNVTFEDLRFFNGYGGISYGSLLLEDLQYLSGGDITSSHLSITENNASVDSTTVPDLNATATITLNGLGFVDSVNILRNGEACPESVCTLVSYGNGTGIFDVTGFTEYSLEQQEVIVEEEQPTVTSTPIYQVMDSGGAGMGLFMSYLTRSLPLLLILLAMVAIITVIGMSLSKVIREAVVP